jgi:membrane protease YdiL (CAAX protease family)
MVLFSTLCALVLTVYVCFESAVGLRKYQRLKLAVARGDTNARGRFYREILVFEWVTAALAVGALGLNFGRMNPSGLELADSPFGRWCASVWERADRENVMGLVAGMAVGTAFVIFFSVRARRRAATSQTARRSPLSRILPDFSTLLPTNLHERLLFALVAISAGICEEIVFRGWLLDVLHQFGLTGIGLVAVASAVFGLAHFYQGPIGILLTGLLGVVFCGLYIAIGSLLLPIVVHAIVDLRFVIMPAPRLEELPTSKLCETASPPALEATANR